MYKSLSIFKLITVTVGFGYRTTGIATTPDRAGSYVRIWSEYISHCQKDYRSKKFGKKGRIILERAVDLLVHHLESRTQ